jgi:hypothetical protein
MKVRKQNIEIVLESEHERQLFLDILDCARVHQKEWLGPGSYSYVSNDARKRNDWQELLNDLLDI